MGGGSMSKKIILFADGTGSAFFKRESNIWRLFDALDTSQNDQIAYYIEGVGTSKFRPWAMFDGATGIGAPENIRKLYRFLCWRIPGPAGRCWARRRDKLRLCFAKVTLAGFTSAPKWRCGFCYFKKCSNDAKIFPRKRAVMTKVIPPLLEDFSPAKALERIARHD